MLMRIIRNFFLIMVTGAFFFGSGFVVSEVKNSYSDGIHVLDAVEAHPVTLILGASLKGGRPNTSLEDRLLTGIDLYHAKKTKKLLVSGDNRSADYNEPLAMKQFLLEKGIPEKDIILDYAGRRTYDSCYRAKEIFDLTSLIVVTQGYHLPRALYLCNKLGIEAVGVSADKREYQGMIQRELREIGASLLAWFNVRGIVRQPVLGKKEKVF
ncbi:MAG: ElyC/SanA/YdcF family protein [Patescibacteria group bacterium]